MYAHGFVPEKLGLINFLRYMLGFRQYTLTCGGVIDPEIGVRLREPHQIHVWRRKEPADPNTYCLRCCLSD